LRIPAREENLHAASVWRSDRIEIAAPIGARLYLSML
jgi:hypothetical protein